MAREFRLPDWSEPDDGASVHSPFSGGFQPLDAWPTTRAPEEVAPANAPAAGMLEEFDVPSRFDDLAVTTPVSKQLERPQDSEPPKPVSATAQPQPRSTATIPPAADPQFADGLPSADSAPSVRRPNMTEAEIEARIKQATDALTKSHDARIADLLKQDLPKLREAVIDAVSDCLADTVAQCLSTRFEARALASLRRACADLIGTDGAVSVSLSGPAGLVEKMKFHTRPGLGRWTYVIDETATDLVARIDQQVIATRLQAFRKTLDEAFT
jgi:hypothetical protein